MATETTEAPPAEKQVSPFAAALDKVFTGEVPEDAPPPSKETKPAVQTEPEPTPEASTRKVGMPRELKKAEPVQEKVEEPPKEGVDAIAEPSKLDAKGKAGWEALKKEARAREQRAAELERQIQQWKEQGKDPETLESKLAEQEKKIAEYAELAARANLELDDSFKREIIEGRNKELDRAKALAEEVEANPDELAAALELRGKARAAAIRELGIDLDPLQAGRLGRIIEKLDEINERADAERANAKEALAKRQEQAKNRQLEEQTNSYKQRLTHFERTSREMKAKLEILNKVDGHDEWNARADSILQSTREFIEAHPNADPEAEIMARSAPVYRDLFLQADAKVEEYEKKIAEMEQELKSIHSKGPSLKQSGADPKVENKRPFSSAIAEAFGQ